MKWILDGEDACDLYFGELRSEDFLGTFEADQLVVLRDLLSQRFPRDGWASPGAIAAVAEYASHRERRERIATAVLAGIAAEPERLKTWAASIAVEWADALIAKLDEDSTNGD